MGQSPLNSTLVSGSCDGCFTKMMASDVCLPRNRDTWSEMNWGREDHKREVGGGAGDRGGESGQPVEDLIMDGDEQPCLQTDRLQC